MSGWVWKMRVSTAMSSMGPLTVMPARAVAHRERLRPGSAPPCALLAGGGLLGGLEAQDLTAQRDSVVARLTPSVQCSVRFQTSAASASDMCEVSSLRARAWSTVLRPAVSRSRIAVWRPARSFARHQRLWAVQVLHCSSKAICFFLPVVEAEVAAAALPGKPRGIRRRRRTRALGHRPEGAKRELLGDLQQAGSSRWPKARCPSGFREEPSTAASRGNHSGESDADSDAALRSSASVHIRSGTTLTTPATLFEFLYEYYHCPARTGKLTWDETSCE